MDTFRIRTRNQWKLLSETEMEISVMCDSWERSHRDSIEWLKNIISEMEKLHERVNAAKVSGSAASIGTASLVKYLKEKEVYKELQKSLDEGTEIANLLHEYKEKNPDLFSGSKKLDKLFEAVKKLGSTPFVVGSIVKNSMELAEVGAKAAIGTKTALSEGGKALFRSLGTVGKAVWWQEELSTLYSFLLTCTNL